MLGKINEQAAVERGFSVGKSILKFSMSTESIVSKKIVRDPMISHFVKPYNSAYSKYKDSLIAAQKAKSK